MAQPHPKPARRIVDPSAQPADSAPRRTGVCPLCLRFVAGDLSRHHVVSRSQGGDDLPVNLVWACGDGVRGCHGVLTHRNRGDHGLTFLEVGTALLAYLSDATLEYVAGKKYAGWAYDLYGKDRRRAA